MHRPAKLERAKLKNKQINKQIDKKHTQQISNLSNSLPCTSGRKASKEMPGEKPPSLGRKYTLH